jgi:hypothetical protein
MSSASIKVRFHYNINNTTFHNHSLVGATFSWPVGFVAIKHKGVIICSPEANRREGYHNPLDSVIIHYGINQQHKYQIHTLREAMKESNIRDVTIDTSSCDDKVTKKNIKSLFVQHRNVVEPIKRNNDYSAYRRFGHIPIGDKYIDEYMNERKAYSIDLSNCQHFANFIIGYPDKWSQSTAVKALVGGLIGAMLLQHLL